VHLTGAFESKSSNQSLTVVVTGHLVRIRHTGFSLLQLEDLSLQRLSNQISDP
jgi:hypothetical protein